MRERLIDLIIQADEDALRKRAQYKAESNRDLYGFIADYLLDKGVIVLPCAVGDTVYVADKSAGNIHPFIVDFIEMNKFEKSVLTSYAGKEQNRQQWKIRISIERFKELFDTTKEEAEAKLAELKGTEE